MSKKMNMKAKILYTCLVMLSALSIAAQEKPYQGKVSIIPSGVEQRGDSLYINLDFNLENVHVKSNQSIDFIPVLVSKLQLMELPLISVKGRTNYKVYQRELSLMNKQEKAAARIPYQVYKADGKSSSTINYQQVLPYEAWMDQAHLDLQEDVCGCGLSNTTGRKQLVDAITKEAVVEPYVLIPYVAYIQPAVEAVKRRELQSEAHLDFEVGKSVIRTDFGNNPKELAVIRKMIETVNSDEDVSILAINISGYASPEGSLATNRRLSERRALALQDYLLSYYDIPGNKYTVLFGGEDWEGLVKLVQASDMSYKQDILRIIADNPADNTRKNKLAALAQGVPYKQMLKELYPLLRRVVIKVDYEVESFDLAKAKEVIKTRPQNLSLNEMYLVANSYEKGSSEFNNVFDVAVRMFPEDPTANLNAAAMALSRKDTESAEKYLNNVRVKKLDPQYMNSMGVLSMLKGDYDEAEKWLKQAEEAGVPEAKSNLEEVGRKRENMLIIGNSK